MDRQYYAYKVPVITKISNWNVLVLHYTKYLLCLDLTSWPPALYPLVQGAVYVVLLAIVVVCHCKVSMTFVLKWRHTTRSMRWNLLVFDEPRSRGPVHNWLGVVLLTITIVISHTKVGLTIDHKWIPACSPPSRNGLEQDELVTIPLVNKGIGVVLTSRVVVGKSEKRVTVDVKRPHIVRSVSLKRLKFNKATSWPFKHSGLNRILVGVCKGDECVTVYLKRRTSPGTFSWYVLKSVKLAGVPFVDNWLCRVGTSIMKVGY